MYYINLNYFYKQLQWRLVTKYKLSIYMKNNLHNCPVNNLFMQLSKQWTLLILYNLSKWEKSFSWIKNKLAWISSRTLSMRLKDLQILWFISRDIVNPQPIKIEYTLTEKGRDLTNELEKLSQWAKKWES